MRHILLSIILILAPLCQVRGQVRVPGPGGAAAGGSSTLTVVHETPCQSGGGSTSVVCAITSTTSGNAIAVVGNPGYSLPTITGVTDSASHTYTHCASCSVVNTPQGVATDGYYILTQTGGVTSVTINGSANFNTFSVFSIYEIHTTGASILYDTDNGNANGFQVWTGPTLTVSANDLVIQWANCTSGITTPFISSPYASNVDSTNASLGGAAAYANNQTSYSQPTWTTAGSYCTVSVIAFK